MHQNKLLIRTTHMTEHIEHLLRNIAAPHASEGLSARIIRTLIALERRRARARAWLALSATTLCLGVGIPALQLLITDVSASGLATYLSLAMSDTQAIASSWYAFFQLVAETLPLLDIAAATAALFALVLLVPVTFRNVRTGYLSPLPRAAS